MASLCDSVLVNLVGKPDAGNPPVRFDEGDQGAPWSLLYPNRSSEKGSPPG